MCTCVQAYMLTCLHAYMRTRLHACAYMFARLYALICLDTTVFLHAYVLTCLLATPRSPTLTHIDNHLMMMMMMMEMMTPSSSSTPEEAAYQCFEASLFPDTTCVPHRKITMCCHCYFSVLGRKPITNRRATIGPKGPFYI